MVCQSLKKPHDECMLLDVLSKTAAEVTLFALALQPQETKEMAPEAKVWSEPEGTIEAFFFYSWQNSFSCLLNQLTCSEGGENCIYVIDPIYCRYITLHITIYTPSNMLNISYSV